MPKETFLKLSEDKKNKILDAAIKEFSRVPIEEASIKNIVLDAGIARGSFYQYFDSKEDVLFYLLDDDFNKIYEFLISDLEKNNDLFQLFINLYDFIAYNLFTENNRLYRLHKMVLNNMKNNGDNIDKMPPPPPPMPLERPNRKIAIPNELIISKVNKNNLRIEDDKDLYLEIELLKNILSKYLTKKFRVDDDKKVREEYIKVLELLKHGFLK